MRVARFIRAERKWRRETKMIFRGSSYRSFGTEIAREEQLYAKINTITIHNFKRDENFIFTIEVFVRFHFLYKVVRLIVERVRFFPR